MARTNQKLINYHGSNDLPSNLLDNLSLGEIAVKHSTGGTAQLVIKTGTNSASTTMATFVESAGVVSMINQSISSVAGNVTEIAQSLSAVSATAVSAATALAEEITKNGEFHEEVRTNLSGHVATLTTNLSENYWTTETIQGKLNAITGDMSTLDTRLTGRIDSLSSATEAFSSSVATNYAKKTEVATAKEEAISSSKTYTDAVSGYIATTLTNNYYDKNAIDGKFETTNGNVTQLGTRIGNAETAISGLSDSVTAMSADVKSYIDNKLSVVYKFKGSVPTYAALTGITSKENGDVYNVDAAQGTIGQPGYVPAGTNYAWNETGNTWDALGGTIDLSSYATTAITDGLHNEIAGVSTELSHLSGHVIGMVSNYATTAQVATAKQEAITTAKNYTDTVSGYIATTLTGSYWTSATTQGKLDTITGDVSELAGRVSDTEDDIEALSSQTQTIETTANAALNAFTLDTVSNAGSTQSGAKAAYTAGGGAVLDLSELVIDCGNW